MIKTHTTSNSVLTPYGSMSNSLVAIPAVRARALGGRLRDIVTVLGLEGGAPGGGYTRAADSSAARATTFVQAQACYY